MIQNHHLYHIKKYFLLFKFYIHKKFHYINQVCCSFTQFSRPSATISSCAAVPIAPNEYGFYANVNPQVDHPRWSQKTERRIGELGRRETFMFNGYAEEVADLYDGMDLEVYY